jgi:ribosomal protein L37AE/L43A
MSANDKAQVADSLMVEVSSDNKPTKVVEAKPAASPTTTTRCPKCKSGLTVNPYGFWRCEGCRTTFATGAVKPN